MCEIFPEVESCCYVASVRVGMLLIAILSITTGAISLGVVEQRTNIGYDNITSMYNKTKNITQADQALSVGLSELSNLIATSVSIMSVIFMFAGVLLLFADLSDQEGFAQMFVWLVFLNIVIGFILVLAIGFECVTKSRCLLGKMDWLSAAATLIVMIFYLIMWYYFICVANSYVLNGYS